MRQCLSITWHIQCSSFCVLSTPDSSEHLRRQTPASLLGNMDLKFVGPMPVQNFIQDFLPPTPPLPSNAHIRITSDKDFPDSADNLILALSTAGISPNLAFANAATSTSVADDEVRFLPLIFVHPKEKASMDPPFSADMFMDRAALKDDPFKDPGPDNNRPRRKLTFQRTSQRRVAIREKQTHAALRAFDALDRVFLFSVLLLDDKARLIRWDRSGAIVTEVFDWSTENSPLVEFLARFDRLSPAQRGFDPTVSRPSQNDLLFAREHLRRAGVKSSDGAPLRMTVTDEVTGQQDSYVCHSARPLSDYLAGRATVGFVAVRLSDGAVVWIKDSWRVDKPPMQKESDTYRRLMDANIPHIAQMLAGGDVEGQKTRTDEYIKARWACASCSVLPHIHHRIVLGTVGRSLRRFRSTFEMVTAVRDALEAHGQAFSKLKLLHGDISPGNILITEDGHGILIDWERAIDLVVEERTILSGTWPFTSAKLLAAQGGKAHTLSDDLESFLYVVLYELVRYRPTGIFALEMDLNTVFHDKEETACRSVKGKMGFLYGGFISAGELREHLSLGACSLVHHLRTLFLTAFYADDVEPAHRSEAVGHLETPTHLIELFDSHLARSCWTRDDAGQDMLKKRAKQAMKAAKRKRKREGAAGDDERRSSMAKKARRLPTEK
ncbi:hypothetical protein OF83DRAFT_863189 [Amylostereum chailletii]|nr:hypothetical protein OF83DRAFT_863189 [Amylostereum chailletii]